MASNHSPFDNFPILGTLNESDTEYEVPTELTEHRDLLAEVSSKPSFMPFFVVGLIVSCILVFRLLNLQVTHGYENRSLAEGNRLERRQIEPPRGIISDRKGRSLVRNIPSYGLEVYLADLPKKRTDRYKVYDRIKQVTGISVSDIAKVEQFGLASLEPFTLMDNIEREIALSWESQLADAPGIVIAKSPRREYVAVPGISHILGYMGKVGEADVSRKGYGSTSQIGKTGLELTYEDELRGKAGLDEVEIDAQRRVQRILSQTSPVSGHNLILHLDGDLQTAAAAALQKSMQDNNSVGGVVVALDPRDGGVLALVSLPSYDNNLFAHGIAGSDYKKLMDDKNRPMLNRAINGIYPPGSTLKPSVAAIALQEKVITDRTTLDTSAGAIRIGQWVFPDWKVHGVTDVRKAIAESNDIFFYAIGGGWNSIHGLGIDRLSRWLKEFGFGSPTGIDLPSEAGGLVPDDAWKRKRMQEAWYIGDTYHMSIGQGYFLSTPMQIANATAAIANGGEILKPHLAHKVVDSDGTIVETLGKEVNRSKFIDPRNLQVVREGMRQAVTIGSARQLSDLPVQAAAKTGTAQFGNNEKTHAWFTAFAPLDNPEIVVTAMVEGGGEGYVAAGPVVKSILEAYFSSTYR